MTFRSRIRQEVLAGRGYMIREMLLTDSQIELFKLVNEHQFMTASELAQANGISVQNASAKLDRLYRSGYLNRLTESAKSGGIEHIYKPNF